MAVMVLVVVGAVLWVLRGRMGGPVAERQRGPAVVKTKRRVEVEGRNKYIVAFTREDTGEDEMLDVDERTFESVAEGARGTLTWEDTRFVRFAKD